MATWTNSNPVSIGDATKKQHYDKAFDNTLALMSSLSVQHLNLSGGGIPGMHGAITTQYGIRAGGTGADVAVKWKKFNGTVDSSLVTVSTGITTIVGVMGAVGREGSASALVYSNPGSTYVQYMYGIEWEDATGRIYLEDLTAYQQNFPYMLLVYYT